MRRLVFAGLAGFNRRATMRKLYRRVLLQGLFWVLAACGEGPATPPPSGLNYAVNSAIYTVGNAITPNTPASSGGAVDVYTVEPGLPTGLSLNTSTGVISGTALATSPPTTYTVTATNSAGSTICALSMTVTTDPPAGLFYAINPAVYTVGTSAAPNTPNSSGGMITSYSLFPGLPDGLSLNIMTGVIGGTPMAVAPMARYTITATNAAGSTTASLTISVNAIPPSALAYAGSPAVYTVGAAIVPSLPNSSGGRIVSYSVSPALPPGLRLDTSTGAITGTPTAVSSTTTYLVTATNSGGSTTAVISITVNAIPPSGLRYSVNPATYTQGAAITANVPSASGGAVVSYSIAPSLPPGLGLDTLTGVISGIPSAASAATTYTVTASNSGGSTAAALAITVRPIAPTALTYTSVTSVYTVGVPISLNRPSNSGGTITAYSVSPGLPAGLGIDAATGAVSGTPAAVTPRATYTITGANPAGSTTCLLTVTVNAAPPVGLGYATNPVIYTQGAAISPNVPSSSGGAVVSYSASPGLPAGLVLSTATGIISGTPATAAATATYTITAANTGGSTTASLTITVNPIPPTGLAYSVNPATYRVGTAITSNTPTSGGGRITSYAVSPALPAGLAINPATGVISGTPTAVRASTTYNVTGSNAVGSTSTALAITVNDIPPMSLTYTQFFAKYTAGIAITPNRPSSSGGAVTSYSVTPPLPAGLTLNTSTGIISGTPATATSLASYTVRAANSGGSTTYGLSITVYPAGTDVNAPQLGGLCGSSPTYVARGGVVTVSTSFTDDISGVANCTAYFRDPGNTYYLTGTCSLVLGTNMNGSYHYPITVPANAALGIYRMAAIVVYDVAGNRGDYNCNSVFVVE